LVEGGRRWWLAELQDEQSVRGFVPDSFAIKQLAEQTGSLGLCIFARRQAPESGLVVRAFPLGVGIFEDPASGAANAAIAAFLEETGNLAGLGRRYTVSQGREIGRDAVLTLEIDANRDVWVGGDCQTVIRGELDWSTR
jgi:PhzF family phenazine biosynthesis protein